MDMYKEIEKKNDKIVWKLWCWGFKLKVKRKKEKLKEILTSSG